MDRVSGIHMKHLAVLFFCMMLSVGARAADLNVSDAWIRVLPGGAPAGGYFLLHNGGKQPVVLIGASSTAFGHVMTHKTTEEGGVSRMMPVERVEVPTGGKVAFAPGRYHLMLMQPTRKVAPGDRIQITLGFFGGQKLTTEFQVRGPAGK